MQVLNLGVSGVLTAYSGQAPHRQAIPQPNPSAGRPLHHFRAMCRFEPAQPYLNTLRTQNFAPKVFRLEGREESYVLHQWPLTAIRSIERFANDPELIGDRAVFVGHSAGGFPLYILACIAKGARLEDIRNALPPIDAINALDAISPSQYATLAKSLSTALFISIGTPYNGIHLTDWFRPLHDRVVAAFDPLLINSLRKDFVDTVYRRIGLRPEQVIHGQMISNAAPIKLSRNPRTLPIEIIMQGGMRAVALITEYKIYDGIAPWAAVYVSGIPEHEIVQFDHLRLVETAKPAEHLMGLIDRSDSHR